MRIGINTIVGENMADCTQCDSLGERLIRVGGTDMTLPCAVCQNESFSKEFRGLVKGRIKDADRFLQKNLSDLEISTPLAACIEKFRGGEGQGLTLFGPEGRGKTQVAISAGVEWCVDHSTASIKYILVPELFLGLRGSFDRVADVPTEFDQMQVLQNVKVLILDDITKERASGYVASWMFMLLDTRYRKMLPTIVTMNTDLQGLADQMGKEYGKYIVSRLVQMNGNAIQLTGRDRRKA